MTGENENYDLEKIQKMGRIALFEGIIIGIYGNWLVSIIVLISLTSNFIWLQILLLCISILSLVALLWIGVAGGKLDSKLEVIGLAFGHFVPLSAALLIERRLLSDIFLLILGALLFSVIYYTEYVRARKTVLRKIVKNN